MAYQGNYPGSTTTGYSGTQMYSPSTATSVSLGMASDGTPLNQRRFVAASESSFGMNADGTAIRHHMPRRQATSSSFGQSAGGTPLNLPRVNGSPVSPTGYYQTVAGQVQYPAPPTHGMLSPTLQSPRSPSDTADIMEEIRKLNANVTVQLQDFQAENNKRLDTLERSVGKVEHSVDALQQSVGQLSHRVGTLENSVGDLQHSVGELSHRVGTLEHSVGEVSHRVGTLERGGGGFNNYNAGTSRGGAGGRPRRKRFLGMF